MSYGINVFDNGGKLILSDSAYCRVFAGRATYVSGTTSGKGGVRMVWRHIYKITGLNTQVQPLFFVRPSSTSIYLKVQTISRNTVNGDWYCQITTFNGVGTGAASDIAEVLVFTQPIKYTSDYGMQTYDSSGNNTTFTTFQRPLALAANGAVPGVGGSWVPGPLATSDGAVAYWAVCPTTDGTRVSLSGTIPPISRMAVCFQNASYVFIGTTPTRDDVKRFPRLQYIAGGSGVPAGGPSLWPWQLFGQYVNVTTAGAAIGWGEEGWRAGFAGTMGSGASAANFASQMWQTMVIDTQKYPNTTP